jgi:hypothetical protein
MDVAHDFPSFSSSREPLTSASRSAPSRHYSRHPEALAALGPVLALCRSRAQCSGNALAAALISAQRAARPHAAVHLDACGVIEALHWPHAPDAPVLVRLPDTDVYAWDALDPESAPDDARWPASAPQPPLRRPMPMPIARHAAPRAAGFAMPISCGAMTVASGEPTRRAVRRNASTHRVLLVRPAACMSVLAWRTWDALRALGDYELVLVDC